MCLYPKLIRNPKYLPTKKNNYKPPHCKDKRIMLMPVGCGKCKECQDKKARGWKVRMMEEIRTHKAKQMHFVTLTLSNEHYAELDKEIPQGEKGYDRDNAIAELAVKRFCDRWKWEYGTRPRRWLVTELGHNGTENIHLHGVLFTKQTAKDIKKIWAYGFAWIGTYVNEATINYIMKYVTKQDLDHKEYQPKIICSNGIGRSYIGTLNANINKYNGKATRDVYHNRQGYKMNLPMYYRNKIYTDQQREALWLQKLDEGIRYVDGTKISIKNGDYTEYNLCLEAARIKYERLGYNNDRPNWDRHQYEQQRREGLQERRKESHIRNMESLEARRVDGRRKSQINKQFERITQWLRTDAERPKQKWEEPE